jgi:hypothetical protein
LQQLGGREAIEIISLVKCQNEEYIAVLSGKHLVREEHLLSQLFVYRKNTKKKKVTWDLKHKVILQVLDMFTQVSSTFYFCNNPDSIEREQLIFSKMDCIFALNFVTREIDVVYKF